MARIPEEFVEVEGVRLHFARRGSGRPVVFLHGNDATHLDFSLSILDRAAAEWLAIAFDRPGHGWSGRSPGCASIAGQARLIHGALEKLGIAQPLIVAHSWSGYLALAYALAFPEDPAGLVLIAPAAYPSGSGFFRDPRFLSLAPIVGKPLWKVLHPLGRPFILRAIRNSFSPAPIPVEWLRAAGPFQLRSASQMRAAAEDFLSPSREVPALARRYAAIRTPAVILTGDRDASVPPGQQACRLARELPNATLVTLPGAGHMLQFSHPGVVMDAIRQAYRAGLAR